jgi:hypothetical protein
MARYSVLDINQVNFVHNASNNLQESSVYHAVWAGTEAALKVSNLFLKSNCFTFSTFLPNIPVKTILVSMHLL